MTYLPSSSRFALRAPHLYGVMFGPELAAFRTGDSADLEAAESTFVSLLRRIHACVDAARWEVDDVTTAGKALLSAVHRAHRLRAHRVLRLGWPRPQFAGTGRSLTRDLRIGLSATTPRPPPARCRPPDKRAHPRRPS